MAKRECPLCKEKVQEKATICKHCKSELPPIPPKEWYQTWKGFLLVFFILWVLVTVFGGGHTNQTTNTPTSTSTVTQKASSAPVDYEHDLTERCKDWIYNRNRAYRLGREGDQKGSEQARIAMLTFMNDLQKIFTEKQISDEIARLEASGYKAGF